MVHNLCKMNAAKENYKTLKSQTLNLITVPLSASTTFLKRIAVC